MRVRTVYVLLLSLFIAAGAFAEIPLMINHQGFLKVNGLLYSGNAYFKFGFVGPDAKWMWTNDGTRIGQDVTLKPVESVTLAVNNGVYDVRLGDTDIPNMVALPSSVFDDASVLLRVIVNDGVNGEQVLLPDQPVTSGAYAYRSLSADATPGSLDGGIISNDNVDALNDLRISPLICRDATNVGNITTPYLVKRVDEAWAPGSDAGAMDLGSVPGNVIPVYIWAIGDSSGQNGGDILFSLNASTPQMPSGYNLKRLIGGRIWIGTGWRQFETVGKGRDRWVVLHDPINMIGSGNDNTPATWVTWDLSDWVPVGTTRLIDVVAMGRVESGNAGGVYIRSSESTDSSYNSLFTGIQRQGTAFGLTTSVSTGLVLVSDTGIIQVNAFLEGDAWIQGLAIRAYLENL